MRMNLIITMENGRSEIMVCRYDVCMKMFVVLHLEMLRL